MLEQIKHNKIKNTGIIYLVLVRKIVDESINNMPAIAFNIFNRYFKKGNQLTKLLELYNLMLLTKYDNEAKASALLDLISQLRMNIDEIKLLREKYACIRLLKSNYNLKKLFQAKLNNYKLYASVYKIFLSLKSTSYNPINIIEAKHNMICHMVNPMRLLKLKTQELQLFSKKDKKLKEQILQLFVLKFNLKYETLSTKQKLLLKKYAYNMSDMDTINLYMDTEIDSLRKSLYLHKDNPGITETILLMDNIKSIKNVQDKIYAVLNLYEILRELSE